MKNKALQLDRKNPCRASIQSLSDFIEIENKKEFSFITEDFKTPSDYIYDILQSGGDIYYTLDPISKTVRSLLILTYDEDLHTSKPYVWINWFILHHPLDLTVFLKEILYECQGHKDIYAFTKYKNLKAIKVFDKLFKGKYYKEEDIEAGIKEGYIYHISFNEALKKFKHIYRSKK